jgi:group I intron endonuclease
MTNALGNISIDLPTVYVLTNRINGKQYVGQTWCGALKRWRRHQQRATSHKGECRALAASIRKYGADSFDITEFPLMDGSSQLDLDEFEKRMIQELNTLSPNGYNLVDGGKGGRDSQETRALKSAISKGRPLSLEHRLKLSQAQTGRPRTSPAEIDGHARRILKLIGKPRSAETCAKMSVATKGRPQTDAQRGASRDHSRFMTGHSVSEETRSKTSKTLKRYYSEHPRSDSTREKLSAALKGRAFTPEHLENIRKTWRRSNSANT